MRLVGASEVIVIPYLTVLSAIVRFGALLLSASALLIAAALAARAAYLELRKFIVLFRYVENFIVLFLFPEIKWWSGRL